MPFLHGGFLETSFLKNYDNFQCIEFFPSKRRIFNSAEFFSIQTQNIRLLFPGDSTCFLSKSIVYPAKCSRKYDNRTLEDVEYPVVIIVGVKLVIVGDPMVKYVFFKIYAMAYQIKERE